MNSNPQDDDPQNNRPRDNNFHGRSHRDPAWTSRGRNMRGKRNPPKDKNRSIRHEPDRQPLQGGQNQLPLPADMKPTIPSIKDLSPAVPGVPVSKMAGTSAATSARYLNYSAAVKNEPMPYLNDPPCLGKNGDFNIVDAQEQLNVSSVRNESFLSNANL
ncbi:hypothetical protein CSOJ01_08675 [Colletotrichum sojae]|uniref:Uncharacterized protein n=1 Tax=Colletotrichum sojae TaxID=2175907 RepID=A0A8H6J635_9PEZI|nr:hypothetical protein CSOJ01_08675 [Colletotrichum sojae]